MNADEIVRALRWLSVETGSLACFGCGREHNCSTHGCAIIRAAADLIESLTAQLAATIAGQETLQRALAASQRRVDAAVGDLRKHRKYKCDCCYYAGKQGEYVPCRDCQSPISTYGDGWQWRGPQAGEGKTE